MLPEPPGNSSGGSYSSSGGSAHDVLSAMLSMAAIVPMVYAVKHVVGSGIDGVTVACVLAGLAGGALFVRRQRRLEQPMLDVELFRSAAFSGAVAATATTMTACTRTRSKQLE